MFFGAADGHEGCSDDEEARVDADRHHEKCVTSTNDKRSGSWAALLFMIAGRWQESEGGNRW